MDDSIRTAKYQPLLTFDMHFPTRQCLVCGTLENYSASMTAVDTSLPWLCDRCRETLLKLIEDAKLKLIEDANTSNALNALEQDNADFFTKGHLHLGYAEEGK